MKITAKQIKEIDNKLTFVIGYRNLANIIVTGIGAVMIFVPLTTFDVRMFGLVEFSIGTLFFLKQVYENIDAISVEDIIEGS